MSCTPTTQIADPELSRRLASQDLTMGKFAFGGVPPWASAHISGGITFFGVCISNGNHLHSVDASRLTRWAVVVRPQLSVR